jgi:hypothetical protein
VAQNTTGKRVKPDTTGIFGGCDNDVDREGNVGTEIDSF